MGRHEQLKRHAACLSNAARYLHHHSGPTEVVQDSVTDPRLLVSGLAERHAFVIDFIFGVRAPDGIAERLSALDHLRHLATESAVKAEMSRRGIDWYLAHPETDLAGADTLLDDAAFVCGNYRVFRLNRHTPRERSPTLEDVCRLSMLAEPVKFPPPVLGLSRWTD